MFPSKGPKARNSLPGEETSPGYHIFGSRANPGNNNAEFNLRRARFYLVAECCDRKRHSGFGYLAATAE